MTTPNEIRSVEDVLDAWVESPTRGIVKHELEFLRTSITELLKHAQTQLEDSIADEELDQFEEGHAAGRKDCRAILQTLIDGRV